MSSGRETPFLKYVILATATFVALAWLLAIFTPGLIRTTHAALPFLIGLGASSLVLGCTGAASWVFKKRSESLLAAVWGFCAVACWAYFLRFLAQ